MQYWSGYGRVTCVASLGLGEDNFRKRKALADRSGVHSHFARGKLLDRGLHISDVF